MFKTQYFGVFQAATVFPFLALAPSHRKRFCIPLCPDFSGCAFQDAPTPTTTAHVSIPQSGLVAEGGYPNIMYCMFLSWHLPVLLGGWVYLMRNS